MMSYRTEGGISVRSWGQGLSKGRRAWGVGLSGSVTLLNLPGAVTGGETNRRRGTGQQLLIRDDIHSRRFGIEATANRNRNNINPKTPTSFSMRWRHSRSAGVILDALTSFSIRRRHSGTFIRKIRGIFWGRRVIDL